MQTQSLAWQLYFSRNLLQQLLRVYRRLVIAPALAHYARRYFKPRGIFIEAGAGTSESSCRLQHRRTVIAFDWNTHVLQRHNIFSRRVAGNLFALPFAPASADGIWNLGVMEHFPPGEAVLVLRECARVLKSDGTLLLFWAPADAWYQHLIRIAEQLGQWCRRPFHLSPPQVNLYRRQEDIAPLLAAAGLTCTAVAYHWRDLHSYVLIVARHGKGN